MPSVTARINQIKQPKGGYLGAVKFDRAEFSNARSLSETENISSSLVGIVIDYLTRILVAKRDCISIDLSAVLIGARLLNKERYAYQLFDNITGISEKSIIAACELAAFDVCFRAGIEVYSKVGNIVPDKSTIHNIAIMVERAYQFFTIHGPLVSTGFTFKGGYTSTISSGDGDYLTQKTLWDMKTIKGEITNKHTLQVLVYYIMGMHSVRKEFKGISALGLFNPRRNIAYEIELDKIPRETILAVESEVIGYK